MANISSNVVIMTEAEYRASLNREFQKGVKRGKFEAKDADSRVARNCVNWDNGRCERCGAQHQYFEVASEFECPHFAPRGDTA